VNFFGAVGCRLCCADGAGDDVLIGSDAMGKQALYRVAKDDGRA
jgi:hypothetical protein